MSLPINQYKKLEEKLRLYDKPFIEIEFLQKLLEAFAPNYQIRNLSFRWLISPIIKGKLYLNQVSSQLSKISELAILAQYGKGKTYAVGGLYLYNQYHFVEQIAQRITVYNTSHLWYKTIAGRKFIFRKVRPSFFRWMEEVDTQGYGKYIRMTPERALLQLIIEKKGQLEYEADIYREIKKNAVSLEKLLTLSKEYLSKNNQLLVHGFLQKWRFL